MLLNKCGGGDGKSRRRMDIPSNYGGEQLEITNIWTVTPIYCKWNRKIFIFRLIPHIGPKTAKRIVDRFGLDTLDIIQYNPEKLKEIEGIGGDKKNLKKIVEAFEEQGEIRDIMVFYSNMTLPLIIV